MSSAAVVVAAVFGILLAAAIALESLGSFLSWLGSGMGSVFQGWATGFAALAALVVIVPLAIYLLLHR